MPGKRVTQKRANGKTNHRPKGEVLPASRAVKPPVCAVVGLGASAGGLEAFREFFQSMPADCGMAFVLIPHLDPRHESILAELLSKQTQMPVEQVRRRAPVQPNHVYVMPPNAPLTIERGVLMLRSPTTEVPRTPIDRFFRSLAEDQGESAICIVLSGTGSDGTLGLMAVKEHGGLTIAQSSGSARYDSMPRSAIATGLVDHVLSVEEMPPKLLEYVRHLDELAKRKGPDGLLEDAGINLARIVQLLKQGTGHDFAQYKKATLIRRIQRRMQVVQAATASQYTQRLRKDKKELEQLFRDLLIGVTQFFRDSEAFAALAREVMPRILAREGTRSVRVWVSACATGEEAYSIAILLAEQLAKLRSPPKVQIFATDIDDHALEVARRARYPEGIAEQVSPERLKRFFTKEGHQYKVVKSVREMVMFSRHNLTRDPPFSRLDLICCRNLLIYLEGELQKKIASLCHYALSSGGYLFLGSSENVVGPTNLFRTVDKKYRIFQRRPVIVATPLGLQLDDLAPERPARERPMPLTTREPGLAATIERILMEQFAPAGVVVDERDEVVYFCGSTGNYLEPTAGAPSQNVVSMARKGLRLDLRSALRQVARSRDQVVREGVTVKVNGGSQRINLIVRPLRELGEDAQLFLVVFQDLAEGHRRARSTKAPADRGLAEQLEGELRSTKDHLQTTIEELENSNEELRSSNEELMSMNEELQSANEEMQTSREELQSVNEELETVNTELGTKVEELDSVNSDLQNLLQSTHIATIFLSSELRINRYTPAATEIFNLIESDIGRPITDITARIEGRGLETEIRHVLRTLVPRERHVRLADREGAFLMRIFCYRTLGDVIAGAVLTFVDISELERSRTQSAHLAALVNSSSDGIFTTDLAGAITTWNAGAERVFGWTAAEVLGKDAAILVPPGLAGEQEEIVHRVVRAEEVVGLETSRLRKDGTPIDVSLTYSPIRYASEAPVQVSIIVRDISDSKRAARELQRANEALVHMNQDLQQLAYATSHDLQEPLRMISNYAQLLSRSLEESLDGKARGFLGNVVAGTERLGTLLRALQEYWSMDHRGLERVPVDANHVLQRAVENLKVAIEERDAEVISDPLPTVLLNEVPLLQLFQNLLGNALKYARNGVSPRVHVAAIRVDDQWQFSVADNGVGVPEKHRDTIFHPFRRLHGEQVPGVGMGLAICARIVGFGGGRIWVENGSEGATFKFTLPAAGSDALAVI